MAKYECYFLKKTTFYYIILWNNCKRGIAMNIFGKLGQFIVNNQEIVQNVAICVLVILCIVFLVFLYKKINNASKKKAESYNKIEGILEDINGNISQLRKQGDFIYIDNSSKKDHEQEALDEAMVLAKSGREVPAEANTKYVGNAFDKEKHGFNSDVFCESIKNSVIDKIADASERIDDEKIQPKRKFDSRLDRVDKFGRVYNVEELEKQIRD